MSEDDRAEAVIVVGGPLIDTARRLAAAGMAAIIQPVPSACSMVLRNLADREPPHSATVPAITRG
ncbi:hypothetical protein [Pseudarthrobacter sp. BRE9]|uniref:hypothetical protein n=1 Tax=Pseudarthrobacter sp. BRE9 TaxID=2962582 RepID=UPI002880F1E0|nr:hypothetical protein [Pseudarthrobacter sp. BRE9]MDT0168478.1 hypothetical protein [Pseudarthrobacter sp. BRE9]